MKKETYIDFVDVPNEEHKTKKWLVCTLDNPTTVLGTIKWYGPWRKYCFFPCEDMVFEEICLRDIADSCQEQTKLYRVGWKKK